MKRLNFLTILFFLFILLSGCSKKQQELESGNDIAQIEIRNGKAGYIQHNAMEQAFINEVKTKVNDADHFNFGPDYVNIKGSPNWDLAIIPMRDTGRFRSVIVPVVKGSEINAFWYVSNSKDLDYNYVDKALIRPPYFMYTGPVNQIYEEIFDFYDKVLNDVPMPTGSGYDDGIFDDAEFGGCFTMVQVDVQCSCDPSHTVDENCNCDATGGTTPYEGTYAMPTDCPPGPGDFVTNSGGGGIGGSGGDGNDGDDEVDPRIQMAIKHVSSVCPMVPQEVCDKLKYIIENVSNSNYCLYIPVQVSNLLENPTMNNIAAASCYVMSTDVQLFPSAPNTCSNPFSSAPLSDFAQTYSEMDNGLLHWATTLPGLDNVPCSLTQTGYTTEEKNQILQALKDHLGVPPATGIDDPFPPTNPDIDKVNALNSALSGGHYPELIDLIPDMLTWDSYDNIPEISDFIKNSYYP